MRVLSLTEAEFGKLPSLRTGQATSVIDGRETRALCQIFSDRTLVIISQLGKVGSLIQVTMQVSPRQLDYGGEARAQGGATRAWDSDDDDNDCGGEGARSDRDTEVPTTTLLLGSAPPGKRTVYDLYAIQIATAIRKHSSDHAGVPVVVGLALAERPGNARGGSDSEDDLAGVAEEEQRRFKSIQGLAQSAYRNACQ